MQISNINKNYAPTGLGIILAVFLSISFGPSIAMADGPEHCTKEIMDLEDAISDLMVKTSSRPGHSKGKNLNISLGDKLEEATHKFNDHGKCSDAIVKIIDMEEAVDKKLGAVPPSFSAATGALMACIEGHGPFRSSVCKKN